MPRHFFGSKQEDIFIANRRFEQFSYSFIKKKTEIEGVVTLSAAGAVVTQNIPGASISKTGTGEYTVLLDDKYNSLYGVYPMLAETAQNLEAKPGAVALASRTVIVNTKVNGTNTDPTATATLYVKIVLSNSSVTSKG